MVFNQQNGYARALNLAYNAGQVLDFGRAHPSGRFVEQKKPWSTPQRTGNLYAALID